MPKIKIVECADDDPEGIEYVEYGCHAHLSQVSKPGVPWLELRKEGHTFWASTIVGVGDVINKALELM